MALMHVHAHVIKKGQSPGGSTGFAQYIAREQSERAMQYARYISSEGYTREDLVEKGVHGLPQWAGGSGTYFFLMADHFERGGAKRPGTVARCYEIALPRELDAAGRSALAADIRATFFARYPTVWALHNPVDTKKQEHPHMHVMLSERRQDDAYDRTPKVWFKQPAVGDQDPATHGVRKDRSWMGPERLIELRAGIATLTNAALEREVPEKKVAVSHLSLKERQVGRAPAPQMSRSAVVLVKKYDGVDLGTLPEKQRERVAAVRQSWQEMNTARDGIREQTRQWENDWNRTLWNDQKRRDGITDLSREAMVAHVRARFWGQGQEHDRTPVRTLTPEQVLEQALEAAWVQTRAQRPLVQSRRGPGALVHGLVEDTAHGGVYVRLDREER